MYASNHQGGSEALAASPVFKAVAAADGSVASVSDRSLSDRRKQLTTEQ
jgi:hypothetical protein